MDCGQRFHAHTSTDLVKNKREHNIKWYALIASHCMLNQKSQKIHTVNRSFQFFLIFGRHKNFDKWIYYINDLTESSNRNISKNNHEKMKLMKPKQRHDDGNRYTSRQDAIIIFWFKHENISTPNTISISENISFIAVFESILKLNHIKRNLFHVL